MVDKLNTSGLNKGIMIKMIKLKIPVNKTEELVFVSNQGMVNIEKYEGDQRIEIPLKEIPKFVDALLFIEHQENKLK
jgi:membrane peptidoglycan carboxypeptidase